MCHEQQVVENEEGPINAKTKSAWMRRIQCDSIYLWACGENAYDEDDAPQLSDRLIGWLVLFMQGFAYVMLIVLARATSTSDTGSSADDSGEPRYLLPSVTGAMYLLVASTAHDLRAGFSLLVDDKCSGHRAFGLGLLLVYGIMISTAMIVLVTTSYDSASLVLNAVTVLFIADLDEKALKFLRTIPHQWRLFWAIQSIASSFVLALIAIFYIGETSPLLEENTDIIKKALPPWFVWTINPAAVTLCSYLLSSTLHVGCGLWSEAYETVDEPTTRNIISMAVAGSLATIMRAKERFVKEPCFNIIMGAWIAQAVPSWLCYTRTPDVGLPFALVFAPTNNSEYEGTSLVVTDNKLVFVAANAMLVTGLALKALGAFLPKRDRLTSIPEQRYSSGNTMFNPSCWRCANSRVPSLLVGWGIGYWVVSLLYVLSCSWPGGGCGWDHAPAFVPFISYVAIPCPLAAGVFMLADSNFLGKRVGAFVKPAVDMLSNRRRVAYWLMATVWREVLVSWVVYCYSLRSLFNNYF